MNDHVFEYMGPIMYGRPPYAFHDRLVNGELDTRNVVIFSVDQQPSTVDLVRAMLAVRYPVSYELIGSYKRKLELSWCIPEYDWNADSALRSIVLGTQESILLLDAVYERSRKARLVMLRTQTMKEIGNFVPVAYEDAVQSDAYTLDPVSCTWYMCR